MISQIEKTIKTHTEKAQSTEPDKPRGPCPHCLEQTSHFTLHERRFRFFRFVVESFVRTIESLLLRWECPHCNKTFTDYPPFALPYKRYVKTTIKQLCTEYLEDAKKKKSYRLVVRAADSLPIYYKDDEITPNDTTLSHTSVWSWIGFFGLVKTVPTPAGTAGESRTFDRLLCKALHIAPNKYRSTKRKRLLQKAKLLLRLLADAGDYCMFSTFPRFETVLI